MAQLKAPKWDGNFMRWKKLMLIWIRSLDRAVTNSDIVSAVVMALSQSPNDKDTGENVCDVILEIEEEALYPPETEIDPTLVDEPLAAALKARDDARKEAIVQSPDKKVSLRNEDRIIAGLNTIISTYIEGEI